MNHLLTLLKQSTWMGNTSNLRLKLLSHFLHLHGWGDVQPKFLAGDASFRTYYRLEKQGQSILFMDAPPPERPQEFCQIDTCLINLGFSAPQIVATDFKHGFVLLEDFGDDTFTRLLNKGEDMSTLYELALDTLIALHQGSTACPSFVKPYSIDQLYKETELFLDWYLPAVSASSLAPKVRQSFADLWRGVFSRALELTSHTLVLRDYHVDNLMRLPNRTGVQACGLLDFQDALWGPVVYDVVSLLEDARLDLPSSLVESLWQRYGAAFPAWNLEQLKMAGCILSAGRHAKIIGIFTRLAVRDGKKDYLRHIPRVWGLLEKCLEHPELQDLKEWFTLHVPIRGSLSC